ncbi:MAG: C1 family peptidase [PVC group bacterium]
MGSVIFLPIALVVGADILPFEPDDTLEDIRYKIDHNGYQFAVENNWVFDMSPNEKASFFSRHQPLSPRRRSFHDGIGPLAKHLGKKTLPASFDWRNYNGRSYIGSVGDQGDCGSCYAFGAAAAAEGTYNWATGRYDGARADFSEAFIAFCLSDHYSGFDGCSGADYDYDELQALIDYGICTETEYPYSDHEQSCPFGTYPALTQFQSWYRVPCDDIDAIKTAIMTYGVVDVAVYVGSAFQGYAHGVYEDSNTTCDGSPCDHTTSNHAVSLVGWDDSPPEGGGGCWILRNSWGTDWGESGYMRIRYTSAVVTCAVSYLVYQPAPSPASLKIQTANVSKIGTFAGNQSIRIFQGLAPDIALLQEWKIADGTYRDYVDEAFGAEFYYFLGYDPSYPDPIGQSWAQNNGIVSRWAIQTAGNWPDTVGTKKPDFAWAEINLPGDTDLLAVSVHLKADAGEAAERALEATLIKTYVEDYIASQGFAGYIVVGGDLNTESQYEWCIQTFATFLEPTSHRPEDRLGNENTNQPRDSPYDWIMPNQLLDNLHDTLIIGTEDYEYDEGIVFDSHVFSRWAETTDAPASTPLWNLPPVLYGDSHSTAMDHMAVMKAFDVFPSPTPSPSVPPTPPPTPSIPPTPRPTASRSPTPRPTPTPVIVMGPISGRVYDRVTGAGIADIYVRAMGPSITSAGISNSQGYYSTGTLNIGTYLVYADVFENPDYRGQYYDQKDNQGQATRIPSNTGGINFPLYRRGVYPTPSPAPTPVFFPASIDSGDYDGDGTSDLAVFRRSSGLWAIKGVTRTYFGGSGDTPVSGDFNGDGLSDIAVFRAATGLWAVRGVSRTYFGRAGDIPVPGDYSGIGVCQIALFRAEIGLWAIRGVTRAYFGKSGDLPIPFNGAHPEKYIAVFRGYTGLWAVRGLTRAYFGRSGDMPVPANYPGLYPGATSLGVFRGSSGLWAIRDYSRFYFGAAGDRPVPGNYRGKLKADIAIFRESGGLWSVRGITRIYFGRSGDLPVTGLAINPSGASVL